MKANRIVSLIGFIILTIVGVISFIICCILAPNYCTSGAGIAYILMELLLAASVIICGILGIIYSVKVEKPEIIIVNVIGWTFTSIAIFAGIVSFILGSTLVGSDAGVFYACGVIFLLNGINALIGAILSNDKILAKKIMFGISGGDLVLCYLLTLISLGATGLSLSKLIMIVVAIVLIYVALFMLCLKPNNHVKQNVNVNEEVKNVSTEIESDTLTAKKEAVRMLGELSKLKDSGVISQEEFDEKKKKYLDQI